MEEDKAAAYYDDLTRKGAGAARFKQGLGFSSGPCQESANKSNFQSSLNNFVKASSPGKVEVIVKEIQIENIREKLKKKGQNLLESHKGRDVANSQLTKGGDRSDVSVNRDRRRSRSSERIKEKLHERYRRSSRERHHSRSPYDKHRRHRSRSADRGTRQRDKRRHRNRYSHSNRNRSTSSDRSREHHHHRRVRHQSSGRSSSWSSDSDFSRKRRRRSLSLSDSEVEGRIPPSHSYRRHRGRTRSPASRRDHSNRRNRKISKSSSPRQQRRVERSPAHRNTEIDKSKFVHRENGKEGTMKRSSSGLKERALDIDYCKLIQGYDSMNPLERVKAKIRLQLSETVVKDSSKGMSEEWERFDFNNEAPLDDDTKLDHFGDDIGARDDTGFLQNTGVTFGSSISQANREAKIQAAHEAAIFGNLIHLSSNTSDLNHKIEKPLQDEQIEENTVGCLSKCKAEDDRGSKGNVLGNSVISEQVYAMQQGSWRDRARKLREQKSESAELK